MRVGPDRSGQAMEAMISQPRVAITLAACAVGIAVAWLTRTPFGLLAPLVALFLLARGHTALVLQASTAIGLAGSLLVAVSYAGTGDDVTMMWVEFFAAALCI